MNCWHQPDILSLWTEEKGGSSGRGLYDERSKEVNLFQIYNTDSGNAMELDSHVDPNGMNRPFHGGKSLPARQEDSKLQILSR